jgi:DNA-3-methyladenine glycosylase II
MRSFEIVPRGPFDLAHQVQYFGEWLHEKDDANAIVLCFPVEGWKGSAAVSLAPAADGRIRGSIAGPADVLEGARDQALACLSLDIDAAEWPAVGKRNPPIGALQEKYRWLRPVLFHSPYEAAAGFIIGHRITIRQRRAVMARMAEELGDSIELKGQVFHAFPGPRVLGGLTSYAGISAEKIERLHGLARAALDGWLDRASLRKLSTDDAREKLKTLRGVGPFFADGILHRGAGLVDDVPNDDLTPHAVQKLYNLAKLPGRDELQKIAESWQPFRTWTTVLIHVWLRREVGLPQRGITRAPKGKKNE